MNFKISTQIDINYQKVSDGFNQKLFEALAPAFPKLELIRYDGESKGDEVHVLINLFIIKQLWVSIITQSKIESNEEIVFIDEGKLLPAPLKTWKHLHRIKKSNDENICFVIDDVTYSTGFRILDWILLPTFLVQFFARKNKYKKYFYGL